MSWSKEKDIKKFILNNNEEFIERYLDKILFGNEYHNTKIEYIGSEVMTGNGLKRCDLLYKVDWFDPIIIVVELKQEIDTNSFIQLCNYINEFKKSHIIENVFDKKLYPFGQCFRYYGVLVGKYLRSSAKELIESELSHSISYVDFYNSEFFRFADRQAYYYKNDDFECNKLLWQGE